MCVLTPRDSEHRIDHRGYVPEIWVGLLLSALYLLQADPILDGITDSIERIISITMAIGCLLCIAGASMGTRWFFPKARLAACYGFQLLGLPLIVLSLAWYAFAVSIDHDRLLLSALGGGLGLCIEIASLRMFVDLVTATRELP